MVADAFTVDEPKTKSLIAKLNELGTQNLLIVTESVDANLVLSARNLPHVDVSDVEAINPVALLSFDKVLMTEGAIKKLESWLS